MKKWKLVMCLAIFAALSYMGYRYYLSLLPMMDAYGELQIRQFTSAVVIHEKRRIFSEPIEDELIIVIRDENGELESIDYNMVYMNQLIDEMVAQTEATIAEVQSGNYIAKDDSRYEKYLENMSEKEGVLTTIPLESLISFPPVSFLHCRIPVRFQVESNVIGKVTTQVESYGINNTLVKVNVAVSLQQKMMLPFFHDVKTIEIEFPIAMKIIRGNIPDVYLGGEKNG